MFIISVHHTRIVRASDTRDLVANRTRAIFVHSAAASCPMSSPHFKLHASRSPRVDTETINCSHSARGIDTCSHVRTIHSITPIRSTRRALIVSSAPERFPSRTELTLHLWRALVTSTAHGCPLRILKQTKCNVASPRENAR